MSDRVGEKELQAEAIRRVLSSDPDLSLRKVAERVPGVSHTFVATIKREMEDEPAGTPEPPPTSSQASRIAELQAEVASLRAEKATLKAEVVALGAVAAKARDEVDTIRWTMVEATRDATRLWAMYGQVEGELWSLKERLAG